MINHQFTNCLCPCHWYLHWATCIEHWPPHSANACRPCGNESSPPDLPVATAVDWMPSDSSSSSPHSPHSRHSVSSTMWNSNPSALESVAPLVSPDTVHVPDSPFHSSVSCSWSFLIEGWHSFYHSVSMIFCMRIQVEFKCFKWPLLEIWICVVGTFSGAVTSKNRQTVIYDYSDPIVQVRTTKNRFEYIVFHSVQLWIFVFYYSLPLLTLLFPDITGALLLLLFPFTVQCISNFVLSSVAIRLISSL